MKKLKITNETAFNIQHIRVVHQYHDTNTGFAHRLSIGRMSGDWAGYLGMAAITMPNGRTFLGTTQYYSLPEVFEIIEGEIHNA